MKKISFILLVFVAAAVLPSAGRAQGGEDVVYLKNGSVVRGVVTEQIPGESLKMKTRDGNLWVFRMDEVSRMTRETAYSRGRAKSAAPIASRTGFNKPRGYLGLVETGMGTWSYGEFSQSMTMVNGYRFFPQLAVGGGVGVEVWDDDEWAMPFFLHLRSDFIRNRFSPFVALNFGTYVSDGGSRDGFGELQGGVSFNVGRRYRMTVGLSYSVCDYYYGGYYDKWSSNGLYDYYESYSDGALKLKVGFSF